MKKLMSMTAVVGVISLFALSGAPTSSFASGTKDKAVKQFSTASNPNGQWGYEDNGALLTVSSASGYCGNSQMGYWGNGESEPNSASIGANQTTTSQSCSSNNTVTVLRRPLILTLTLYPMSQ